MKVRLKVPKEVNGEMAQPGWVFGVDEPTGLDWIAAGDADKVDDNVRALKYDVSAPLMIECVTPPVATSEAPAAPSEGRMAKPQEKN